MSTAPPTAAPGPPPAERPLGEYVAAVASASPTPGGGSVAGVVGALAAALAEMVCNLTFDRPVFATAEAELRAARTRAEELRLRLLELAAADEAAYAGYRAATGLPKTTPEERAARRDALQAALRGAAAVPAEIAAAGLELLTLLDPIARLGNPRLRSDAEVAALLAEAAVRAAGINVRVNAALLADKDEAAALLAAADATDARVAAAAKRIATSH